jgi:hypothetical protein
MTTKTIHGKLVAKKDGLYTVYVFQLDNNEYIMCTKLPNWGSFQIQLDDTGFVTVEEAYQGEEYIDRITQEKKNYSFSNIYFKDFVKDNNIKEIIL